MRYLSVFISALALVTCSPFGEYVQPKTIGSTWTDPDKPVDTAEGAEYIRTLIVAIHKADRITVTEHSWKYDWVEPLAMAEAREPTVFAPPATYARRVLDAHQKERLLEILQGLDPTTQQAFPACIFEPHHTVTFERAWHPNDALEICFGCGQIEWGGTSVSPPSSIYNGLARFVSSVGMQPTRDWYALAAARVKKAK